MPDMEKVINELSKFREELRTCNSTTYVSGAKKVMRMDLIDKTLALLEAQEPITGETSDGYHTFNELYHHRAVLFSVIVSVFHDMAWKSKKHHDGTMFDGMFIVGIDTPDGQATYHYDIDPYWGMFNCRVLDNAPEWDGHTPAQAIERIGKLKAQDEKVVNLTTKIAELTTAREPVEPKKGGNEWDSVSGVWWYKCGVCGEAIDYKDCYCRHCGLAVKWE